MKRTNLVKRMKKGYLQQIILYHSHTVQHAKKVLSDSLGLVDFPVGQVDFIHNEPDVQMTFFGLLSWHETKTERNVFRLAQAGKSIF